MKIGNAGSGSGNFNPLAEPQPIDTSNLPDLPGEPSIEALFNKNPELEQRVIARRNQLFDRMVQDARNTGGQGSLALAEGKSPIKRDREATAEDVRKAKRAMEDMLIDMPIAALSPRLASLIYRGVKKLTGTAPTDLPLASLRDYGEVGSDIVKEILTEWAEHNPKQFKAVYAGVFLAAGNSGGSELLEDLDMAPEISAKFFDDRAEAFVGIGFDKGFENAKIDSVGVRVNASSDTVSTAKMKRQEDDDKVYTLEHELKDDKTIYRFNVEEQQAESGYDFSLSQDIHDPYMGRHWAQSVRYQQRDDDKDTLSLSLSYEDEGSYVLSTSLEASRDEIVSGSIRMTEPVTKDSEVSTVLSYDEANKGYIGLGFTWDF